jgi:uncharacterized protein YecE (DUF72 family)
MIYVGTSGYNYPEWKGSFYPATLASSKMLGYYAERLPTVEINYTFYRLPSAKTLAGWREATPDGFRFTLKAPRRITHDGRLRGDPSLLLAFCDLAAMLGPKLAALLFQLPPFFKKDLAVLDAFLDTLPSGTRAAFEFRHPSWLDDEVYARLRGRNLALCVADADRLRTPVVITADYGYFRLRDAGYTDADLARWAETIAGHAASLTDTFVYFKHEDEGVGPAFARTLIDSLGL